jgi:hypothetical protein
MFFGSIHEINYAKFKNRITLTVSVVSPTPQDNPFDPKEIKLFQK